MFSLFKVGYPGSNEWAVIVSQRDLPFKIVGTYYGMGPTISVVFVGIYTSPEDAIKVAREGDYYSGLEKSSPSLSGIAPDSK